MYIQPADHPPCKPAAHQTIPSHELLQTLPLLQSPNKRQQGQKQAHGLLCFAHCCHQQLYAVELAWLKCTARVSMLRQHQPSRKHGVYSTARQERCRAVQNNCTHVCKPTCACVYHTKCHCSSSTASAVSTAQPQTSYPKQPHASRRSCTVCHRRRKKYSTDPQQPSAAASSQQHHTCMPATCPNHTTNSGTDPDRTDPEAVLLGQLGSIRCVDADLLGGLGWWPVDTHHHRVVTLIWLQGDLQQQQKKTHVQQQQQYVCQMPLSSTTGSEHQLDAWGS